VGLAAGFFAAGFAGLDAAGFTAGSDAGFMTGLEVDLDVFTTELVDTESTLFSAGKEEG